MFMHKLYKVFRSMCDSKTSVFEKVIKETRVTKEMKHNITKAKHIYLKATKTSASQKLTWVFCQTSCSRNL